MLVYDISDYGRLAIIHAISISSAKDVSMKTHMTAEHTESCEYLSVHYQPSCTPPYHDFGDR